MTAAAGGALSVTPYDPLFASAGVQNNVDPNLLAAVSAVESGYNPKVVSPTNDIGLMQLQPGTASDMGVQNPVDPGQNVNGGAKYLSQQLSTFGNVPQALAAYHVGAHGNLNGPEAQGYIDRVQAAYADIKAAGGIQYGQPSSGGAAAPAGQQTAQSGGSDVPLTSAPVAGRPSDDQMLQMMMGGSGPAGTAATPPPATGMPAVAPVAGRPSDAAMLQLLTGGGSAPNTQAAQSAVATPSTGGNVPVIDVGHSYSPNTPAGQPGSELAPSTPGGVAPFPIVPAHPTPDGSGGMTNLSDADYYRFTGQAPPPATGASQAPQAGQGAAPGAPQGTSATGSTSAPSGPTLPPWVMAAGTGALDAYRGVARTVANGAGWVDSQVPALAGLDNAVGLNPQQVSSGIMADINANRARYGSNPAYIAGNIGGNLAAAAPMMALGGAGVGAVGDALGTAFPGVTNALIDAANGVRSVKVGNLLLKGGGNALTGAAQGAGVGAATSGASNAPIGQQIKQGAELGGIAGAVVPAAVGAIKGIGGAALGGSTDAATAALAQQAKGFGIPITLGQLSNNASVHTLDSMSRRVPFSGSSGQAAAQQTAFNRAVGGTIGQAADKITPQVMSTAKAQIGATMNQIESSNAVSLDGPFLNQVAAIEKNAQSSLTDPEFKVVSRQLDNVMANLQAGDTITGQTYGNLIHKGSPLDAALNSRDSNIANYAGQIKGALQDALTRSLSPADQAAYTQARYQYRNLKTIEDLAEKSPTGDISPAGLMQAVRSSYGDMAYTGGGGDLGTLARIGQRFLKEPPDSGTAGRLTGLAALTSTGGLLGNVLTGATAPEAAAGSAAAALGTIGLARGVRAYLGSSMLANRLIQNGLNPGAGGLVNRLTNATTAASPTVAAVTNNRLLGPQQRNTQGR